MRILSRLVVATAFMAAVNAGLISTAAAKVRISVDLDSQTMHVEAKDQTYDWKVSSGKTGYETPTGTYGVLWTDKDHHSDEYEQAPMPNSIFFKPGFAIHGFGKSPWGHAASHGCIRLPVAKSAILFDLVAKEGAEITITGETPEAPLVAERRHRHEDRMSADAEPAATRSRGYDGADGYQVPPAARPAEPYGDAGFGSIFGGVY